MDWRRKFNWQEIQIFYDLGNSLRDVKREFGCSLPTIFAASKRNEFKTRPRHVVSTEIFQKNSTTKRGTIKKEFSKHKPHECEICGQKEIWNNQKLIMVLDHINGIKNDSRFENLRFLCPNCNSQTETFSGRNIKYLKKFHEEIIS